MTLPRRLVFVFLAISSLLCLYVLCLNLEVPAPWRMVQLTAWQSDAGCSSSAPGSRSHDSDWPLSDHGDQWTRTPAVSSLSPDRHHIGSAAEKAVAELAPDSEVAEGARTVTKETPRLPRPANPVASTGDFIGDTYDLSEDFPLQTNNCSESGRRKVQTSSFSGDFLQNIPVFQWAKHGTPEQYQRLSRYSGAHGWQGVDYETLTEALSVLNSSANWRMFDDWERRSTKSQCIRCAVVGNGGILKDSHKGSEIDSHDYVFRTNGAIIRGFEGDVGSRTTHYTFSTNTLRNSMRRYTGLGYTGPPQSEETHYLFLPDHDRDYLLMRAAATHTPVEKGPERSNEPPKYFGENVSAEKLKMYHPDFIRYIRNRFLRSHALDTHYKELYRPSTGAVMLLAALHTCDQVSAYGFMTPDYRSYSDHYYDATYHPVGFFINHDLRMEMSLWQRLHRAGLVRLYMRQ